MRNRRLARCLIVIIALSGVFMHATPETIVQAAETGQEEVVTADSDYIFSELDTDAPAVSANASSNGLLRSSTIPSAYGVDEDAIVGYPALRSQNPYGTCWAFASLGLAEMDAIEDGTYTADAIDLSELQLAYFTYNFVNDPLGGLTGDTAQYTTATNGISYLDRGGNFEYALRRLAQWVGAVSESDVPYTDVGSVLQNGLDAGYAYALDKLHLQNAYRINLRANASEVKKQIMLHGAAGVSYSHQDGGLTYNSNLGRYVYYDTDYTGSGHAVMIVGWDDNFSKENFTGSNQPQKDGAWLVRNSWGDYAGYFWMSYETTSLNNTAWIFDVDTADNYDNNYQLDGGIDTYYSKYTTTANVFTVDTKEGVAAETLEAVSLSTMRYANVGYIIRIYTNLQDVSKPTSGTLQESAITTGTTTYAGINTIELSNPVLLMPNTSFAVVVTLDTAALDYEQAVTYQTSDGSEWACTVSNGNGKSFYSTSDKLSFIPWGYGNFCIKAYTQNCATVPTDIASGTHNCDNWWNTDYTVDREPTCTDTGSKSIHCSICGAIKDGSTETIPATGHQWQQTGSQGGVTTYRCSACGTEKKEGTAWTGLHKAADGKLYLYENGNIKRDYTELYCDSTYGWKKIVNGVVDSGYSDLYYSPSCGWWKISGGSVDFGYSDLYYSPSCGWWKVINGTVDFGYSDLYYSPSCGWWKVSNGTVDFGYSDLYYSPSCGWWKVSNGSVDFGYSDLYYSPSFGWWKVYGGYVDFGYNGWYNSPAFGWWQISGGAVVFR